MEIESEVERDLERSFLYMLLEAGPTLNSEQLDYSFHQLGPENC